VADGSLDDTSAIVGGTSAGFGPPSAEPFARPTLPAPPDPWPDSSAALRRQARAGELDGTWRVLFVVGWVGVLLGVAAVWRSARTIGLSTWWLGSASEPQFLLVQMLPLIAPVLLVVGGLRGVRFLPYLGLVGALVLAAIGTGDLGEVTRLAIVQLALAGAGAAMSVASFAGMLRPAPVDTAT
jgi:hypothetical protein